MKVVLALVLLACPMVMAQEAGTRARGRTPPVQEPESAEPSKADKDREEVSSLINEMESTLEQIGSATVQVSNVRKIFEKLDQGVIKATEKELVKTNQLMRQSLTKEFRELRARSRSVLTQVSTTLLPKQRGVAAKLKARFEIEPDAEMKSKIGKLLGDQEQAMTETAEQVKRLETNIQQLSGAIQILEGQLSYLDLVEESLGLSKEVSSQLRSLNQEIDKVVMALMEKEMKQ